MPRQRRVPFVRRRHRRDRPGRTACPHRADRHATGSAVLAEQPGRPHRSVPRPWPATDLGSRATRDAGHQGHARPRHRRRPLLPAPRSARSVPRRGGPESARRGRPGTTRTVSTPGTSIAVSAVVLTDHAAPPSSVDLRVIHPDIEVRRPPRVRFAPRRVQPARRRVPPRPRLSRRPAYPYRRA